MNDLSPAGEPDAGNTRKAQGVWPSPLRQVLWDFLPAAKAPNQSGLEEPVIHEPEWLAEDFADTPQAAEQARRAHDQELERAHRAEEKGSRLAQTSLGLLALSLTLAGLQANFVADRGGGWWYLLLTAVACAVVSFVLAAIEAAETDRVGLFRHRGADALRAEEEDLYRAQVRVEETGRQLASWTANHKLDRLLQARAWLTRGIATLILAALLHLVAITIRNDEVSPEESRPSPTPEDVSDAAPSPKTSPMLAGGRQT